MQPLLIIGLDGAGFNLLDRLFARGDMPHLQRLAETGVRTELLSTLPVATLPAWTSFLTACHPSQHGVTDLFMRQGNAFVPATGRMRTVPTFLAELSQRGRAVAALSVPGTYPPEPLPGGLCIAGFDAPGSAAVTRQGVWPPMLYRRLQQLGGWRFAAFNEQRRHDAAHVADVLLRDIDRKEHVITTLLDERRWDVFFVHLQASDTAAHHLWHTFDADSPRATSRSDALPQVYRRLDALIGTVLQRWNPAGHVMVVSDHGMGGASNWAVYLNRFLHRLGVLRFAAHRSHTTARVAAHTLRRFIGRLPRGALGWAWRSLPQPLLRHLIGVSRGSAVDRAQSLAFSDELDYAPSIWIHRQGQFPAGRVASTQYEGLLDTITTALRDWRYPHTGTPVVAAVHRRAQLPVGPHIERMPDLLVELAWPGGYRPSCLVSSGPGPSIRQLDATEFQAPRGSGMPGVHQRAGIFILHGSNIRAMELPALHIHQAGALVYALAGVPLPAHADATIPDYVLDACGVASPDAGRSRDADTMASPVDAYDPAHAVELTQRLADMGYL